MTTKPLIQNDIKAMPQLAKHAKGVWIYDTEGNDYLDACAGAVVVNVGHSHPRVLETLKTQSEQLTFVHRSAFSSEAMHGLAQRLTRVTGFAGAWFVNSGSEAVEAGLQFALQYHAERGEERTMFLSHARGYHGNTLGALSLSGHIRRSVLGGLALDFNLLPDPYVSDDTAALLAQVDSVVREHSTNIAAIVFEPLSGATLGCNPLPEGYLAGLRKIADEHGILLLADEVMTGLGRTGKWLACDHWDVKPDLVALGKGLGAGYTPISAALVSERVLTELRGGSGIIRGGHTYGGNPLSVAVANEVLKITETDDLITTSRTQGEYLRKKLHDLAEKHRVIKDIRGLGLMLGVELHSDASKNDPQGPGLGESARRKALDNGLLIYSTTGGFNDAFIIAPPLTITTAEIDVLVQRLDRTLGQLG